MLTEVALIVAADAAARFGTAWLDANPLHVVVDRKGLLHRDFHCTRLAGPAEPTDLWLHRADNPARCWCLTSVHGKATDWLACARVLGRLDRLLAEKHTCFDALEVRLGIFRFAGTLHYHDIDPACFAERADATRAEAQRRLEAASAADRDAARHAAAELAHDVCGDGDGYAVVLVDWDARDSPTLVAPYPHAVDGRHLVAAVPDVVAHAVAATTGPWDPELGGVHVEHVERAATADLLETALGLWRDLEHPAQAWAAAVALTT